VAELSYKIKTKHQSKNGKKILAGTVSAVVAFALIFIVLSPPDVIPCNKGSLADCGCPSSKSDISSKNLLLIDVTDPIRATKVGDLKSLVAEGIAGEEAFWEWLMNGKRVSKTSLYLITNQPPADTKPLAVFCSAPPKISQFFSNSSFKDIRIAQSESTRKVEDTLLKLTQNGTSARSPIIESLATYTSNASAWSKNGTLTLASDLLENSDECGFFEHKTSIPEFSKTTFAVGCQSKLETMTANLGDYPTIALCKLPGKGDKPGLTEFWRGLFQGTTQLDVVMTCDWNEIKRRQRDVLALKKNVGR